MSQLVDAPTRVRTGAHRLADDPSLVTGSAVGLFTNYTAVMPDLTRDLDALLAAGVPLTTVFTPEHGMWGAVQAGESEPSGVDEATGLPVLDTYQRSGASLDALVTESEVDVVLFDLQDIGVRFYTYIWSLYDLLCSSARTGVPVVVLDRPNPLGAATAGPGLVPSCSSFVGRVSVPLRHGLTTGELAQWFAAEHVPDAVGARPKVDVVVMAGWRPDMSIADTGLPWVMPSPNMPTFDTALVYPGTGLIEGTTASEGRGTTRPFEIIGAPYVDLRLAPALNERGFAGARFRDLEFRPTHGKWAGSTLRGVQVHVLDPGVFEPVETGIGIIAMLAELYPQDFAWRPRDDEQGPPFIDLLWGSPALREGIDAKASTQEIIAASPPAPQPPPDIRLYR